MSATIRVHNRPAHNGPKVDVPLKEPGLRRGVAPRRIVPGERRCSEALSGPHCTTAAFAASPRFGDPDWRKIDPAHFPSAKRWQDAIAAA